MNVRVGLKRLGLKSLREYYKTPHWAALVREMRKKRCDRCGRACGRLALHHKTYLRLGAEAPEDLETLGDPCHRAEHGLPPRRGRGRKKGR